MSGKETPFPVEKQLNSSEKTSQADFDTVEAGVQESEPKSRRDFDVAAKFLENVDPSIKTAPIEAAEARKVLWKVDFTVLPLLTISIIIGAIDKGIISNAAIYGMRTDTKLVGDQYSWLGSALYFGFLIFEMPCAWFIQRFPVAKFLSAAVFGWGVLMMCTAATQNFGGLLTVRFLIGMLEAVTFPVCAIMTVMWWKTTEQPIRLAFWSNQFSFTGIISFGLGHTNTAVAPWRLIFLVLGAVSILWSVVLYVFLPDSPTSCWYLSEREKFICLDRVKDNNTGVEAKEFKWYQVRECLKDPKTWLLALFSCAQNIANGGLVTFASIIVSGLGYTPLRTTLLGMPTGVLATSWQLILAVFCAKIANVRCMTIATANLLPIACAVLMWKLPRSNQNGLLASYYAFYTYWAPYTLSTSLPMANVSGHTKKVTMNGIFFLSYCIGNIIGPQVFRAKDAPNYSHGYQGLLGTLVVAMASIAGYGLLCFFDNKRRDGRMAMGQEEVDADAFTDLTDKEKLSFRYSY